MRKVFLGLVSSLAVFFLLLTAIDAGVLRVVGSPEPIKQVLADSGIYKSIIPSSLEQAGSDSTNDVVPFDNPLVISAAESTFGGEYLEKTTGGVIDSIYRWLEGQTPVPDFKIDLTKKKTEFATKVGNAVSKRVADLPRCTTSTVSGFDAFEAKCHPAGVAAPQAGAAVKNQLLKSDDFLEDTVITASDIKSADSDKPFFGNQLKNAPEAYQKFKASPVVLAIFAVLALAGTLLLSRNKLSGLKHVGFILAGVGIFLLIFAGGINEAVDNKVISQISLENQALQDNVRQLVGDIADRVSNSFLVFGAIYSGLGALGIGSYFYLRRRAKS